jgi:hypothetical protein
MNRDAAEAWKIVHYNPGTWPKRTQAEQHIERVRELNEQINGPAMFDRKLTESLEEGDAAHRERHDLHPDEDPRDHAR